MKKKITCTIKELEDLMDWVQTYKFNNDVSDNTIVHIENDSSSGIGTQIVATIKISEYEGVYKDFTDYERW